MQFCASKLLGVYEGVIPHIVPLPEFGSLVLLVVGDLGLIKAY